MGYDFYSKDAHYAFHMARQEAIRQSSACLGTDHLVLGLLRQYTKKDASEFFDEFSDLYGRLVGMDTAKALEEMPELFGPSAAARILEQFGVTLDGARSTIAETKNMNPSVDLNLGPDLSRLLERAHALRQEYRHRQIGTEHLLLALLEDKSSSGYKTLFLMNTNIEGMRQSSLSAVKLRQEVD